MHAKIFASELGLQGGVGPLFQGQDWETLHTGHGNGALGTALYLARKHSDNTLRELGELAGGMQYPAVTMAIRRLAKRLEDDKALARKVKRVEKMLFVDSAEKPRL